MGTAERRYQRLRQRRRRKRLFLLVPAIVLLIATTAMVGSGAAFTSSSANLSNLFSAGILKHTNSKSGSAILTADKLKPGDSRSGTVVITNDGDFAGAFSITTSNLANTPGVNGGNLSAVLTLRIFDQTTSTEVYNGKIDAVGTVAAGTFAVSEARTYQFTITFPDGGIPPGPATGDNLYKGSSMSIQFDWTQVSQ